MKDWIQKNWGIACLVLAVLLLCVTGTMAAYTNFSSARRLVSVKAGNKALFSSNLLYAEEIGTAQENYRSRKIVVAEDSFTLEIYNYFIGDTTTYNEKTITYTLKITLSEGDGSGFSVNGQTFTNGVLTLNHQILAGGQLSKNSYVITVPEEKREQVKMWIEAVPTEDTAAAAGQKKQTALIVTGAYSVEINWTGRLIDSQQNRLPKEYDGFNYEIAGNGEGNVTLTWNSSVLQIDPWFANQVGSAVTQGDGSSSLTFPVGGSDQVSAYQLQFYWVGLPQEKNWEELKNMVHLIFTPVQQ